MHRQSASALHVIAAAIVCTAVAGSVCHAQQPESGGVDRQPATQPAASGWLAKLREMPLPTHTLEGYGGGAITPVAYLVNPGKPGSIFGLPAVSASNLTAGRKNVQAFVVTETLFGRVELGYGLDRIDLGTLPGDIRKRTGIDIDTDEVWLNNFNVRTLLLEEGSCNLAFLPAVTGGVHFKVNEGIGRINDRLHGTLTRLGYEHPYGTDFTLTATKTIVHKLTLDRPLALTAGMRASEAAYVGVLGFGDRYRLSVEAAVGYLITDYLGVKYEFRQNRYPYHEVPGLLEASDNWNAVGATLILGKHLTIDAGWGRLGTVANTVENGAWWIQLKYEF